ncbi:hypothetical protein FH972_024308 [Carpinus fangiana]|uniref:Uncharacterized protein n=1 Tax=Carpinus fangiana TaxID=176857 RepID=A0A5N6KXP0_9ROSI|nr:hypothetical protein FH972_024308 [Carpinus fangiana]
MGFLKHFRSKSRLKQSQEELPSYPRARGPDPTTALPNTVLRNIFSFVCPHVTDETYEVSERSQLGSGCGLCDLRDLAHCTRVNRQWYNVAQDLLYHSVRIDAVHFCPIEEILSAGRKKKHIDPAQIPAWRLRQFQATVWKNSNLASRVEFFKLPYMTRETNKADLARTVTALPNLRHVDLPDGFFSADPSTQILRDELASSCLELRRMSYYSGAEQVFESLAHYRLWMNLEVLDLKQLDIDLTVLRVVLASLPVLQELKLREMPKLDDAAFQSSRTLPDFPALLTLRIEDCAGITASGLSAYLSRPDVREVLTNLALTRTGVTVPTLHRFISLATNLLHLSVSEVVIKTFPLEPTPPISSHCLKTLNFEVTSNDSPAAGVGAMTRPSDSYYSYLAQCLHANALPTLGRLFVRDSNFPELLMYPPPNTAFAPQESGGGFNQMLEVFTKGNEDLDWVYTPFAPQPADMEPEPEAMLQPFTPPYARQSQVYMGGGHRRGQSSVSSIARPVSAYGASKQGAGFGPSWGVGEARKSVMMGNGQGGFLAVPQELSPPSMPAALSELSLAPNSPNRPGSSGGTPGSSGGRPGSSSGRRGSSGGWRPGHFKTDSASRKSKGDLWR